eukprot:GAHX01004465.1.p1 GENE.GAHX01004465.1~~GAHX01004465.1.p1  ORF type:complete len:71 (-),score=10.18 GAHX01004465.1:122-334(-)
MAIRSSFDRGEAMLNESSENDSDLATSSTRNASEFYPKLCTTLQSTSCSSILLTATHILISNIEYNKHDN